MPDMSHLGLAGIDRDICLPFSQSRKKTSRDGPSFPNGCPCGGCCRGLASRLLYVGPLSGNLVLNVSWHELYAQ